MRIAPFDKGDYDVWRPLFEENNLNQLAENIAPETWKRLHEKDRQIHGLGLWMENVVSGKEELVGLVHYVLHPVTGAIEPACYMEDLYIIEPYRRQGLAKMLVKHLVAKAKEKGWSRFYWFADKRNEGVQAFYKDKDLGVEMPFGLHFMPLDR